MNKYNGYRTIIFTITTALVFFIWSMIQPILVGFIGLSFWNPALIGAIISLGSYRFVLKLVEALAIKFKLIKKIVFGRSYLDGIWVGAYIGRSGKPRFFVEYFEQDFNSLVIRSKCYFEDGRYRGEWKSRNASIDEDKGELYYTYDTTMEDKGFKTMGFAIFTFDRKNKLAAPNMIYGFSSDISSEKMNPAVEEKITKKKILSDQELLERAIEVYQKYKDTMLKQ
ncbi:hypothetical protein [Anaerosporobacter sp.]|uniref:hypothetical protein n=1 Tax=Anaerosporobacter sp. TaxID=1872529 RepID=UPI00286F7E95|nr:hypothetical protein [Anaerosporobacter sp.]